MTKYEYKKVAGIFGQGIDEGVLNACGRQGWKLVTAVVCQPIIGFRSTGAELVTTLKEGYNEYIFVKETEE